MMKNAFRIFKNDIKNIFKNTAASNVTPDSFFIIFWNTDGKNDSNVLLEQTPTIVITMYGSRKINIEI